MFEPAFGGGGPPENLALWIAQVPVDRRVIGVNGLIIRAINLGPVANGDLTPTDGAHVTALVET